MKIKVVLPLHNYVAVIPEKQPETTEHGIILPENSKESPQIGFVAAYGNGIYQNGVSIPMPSILGKNVLFMKYAGIECKVDDQKVLLLKDTDIIAIVEE